jgi:hypothetical protein
MEGSAAYLRAEAPLPYPLAAGSLILFRRPVGESLTPLTPLRIKRQGEKSRLLERLVLSAIVPRLYKAGETVSPNFARGRKDYCLFSYLIILNNLKYP